jgi:hypothetical protein
MGDAYRATANALTQLPNFNAMCRLISSGKHLEATVATTDWEPLPDDHDKKAAAILQGIKDRTHDAFCRPRKDVEDELEERYSRRLQAIGLPPLTRGHPLPEVDRAYESEPDEA